MRSVGKWVSAILAAQLACAGGASAQTGRECSGADGPFTEAVAVARVGGKDKTHFVQSPGPGRADCPGPNPKCRESAYLLPGNLVLTASKAQNGFVCTSFINSRGVATRGWLPAAQLMPILTNAADNAAWLGNWQRVEASIKVIRDKDGALTAEGEATWGAGDKGRVARGAVNIGDFGGKLRLTGDIALVADDDIATFETAPKDRCVVRLRVAGPYMQVEDNRACGGMNVSFSGLYIRR